MSYNLEPQKSKDLALSNLENIINHMSELPNENREKIYLKKYVIRISNQYAREGLISSKDVTEIDVLLQRACYSPYPIVKQVVTNFKTLSKEEFYMETPLTAMQRVIDYVDEFLEIYNYDNYESFGEEEIIGFAFDKLISAMEEAMGTGNEFKFLLLFNRAIMIHRNKIPNVVEGSKKFASMFSDILFNYKKYYGQDMPIVKVEENIEHYAKVVDDFGMAPYRDPTFTEPYVSAVQRFELLGIILGSFYSGLMEGFMSTVGHLASRYGKFKVRLLGSFVDGYKRSSRVDDDNYPSVLVSTIDLGVFTFLSCRYTSLIDFVILSYELRGMLTPSVLEEVYAEICEKGALGTTTEEINSNYIKLVNHNFGLLEELSLVPKGTKDKYLRGV